ncbi:hypothetical protein ACTG9Q_27710 [Actinokineospora sp. 24-640]
MFVFRWFTGDTHRERVTNQAVAEGQAVAHRVEQAGGERFVQGFDRVEQRQPAHLGEVLDGELVTEPGGVCQDEPKPPRDERPPDGGEQRAPLMRRKPGRDLGEPGVSRRDGRQAGSRQRVDGEHVRARPHRDPSRAAPGAVGSDRPRGPDQQNRRAAGQRDKPLPHSRGAPVGRVQVVHQYHDR